MAAILPEGGRRGARGGRVIGFRAENPDPPSGRVCLPICISEEHGGLHEIQ
jgi:hypothetical protein